MKQHKNDLRDTDHDFWRKKLLTTLEEKEKYKNDYPNQNKTKGFAHELRKQLNCSVDELWKLSRELLS